MKNMIKWIKKESWLVCMLLGISLLTWSMVNGEIFTWQIPIACLFVIGGVMLESNRL